MRSLTSAAILVNITVNQGCDKRFTQSSNLTAHEKTHKEMEKKEGSSSGGQVANSEKKEGKPIFGLKQDDGVLESVHSLENEKL